jgi:hypothetical protein
MDANGWEWMRMDANDSEWMGMAENVRIAFSPLFFPLGFFHKKNSIYKRIITLLKIV